MVQFCYLRPYLGIETIFYRLLLRMARMEKNAGFRTLENVGPNFSSSVIICLQKTPKKIMIRVLSLNLFDIIFFFVRNLTLQKIVFSWLKQLNNDFSNPKRPRTTISLMGLDREIAPFKST